MKMTKVLFFAVFLISCAIPTLAAPKDRRFDASGEIVSADPLYHRVTIKHGAIKGFSGPAETEFVVSEQALFKGIEKRDLVDFTIVETKGDVSVEEIVRTGVAEPERKQGVGKVVQDVLVGTGEVAKTVTSPIAPAHQVVSGTVDATTSATGAALDDASTEVKQEF